MKAFFVTLTLFILMIAVIVCNAIYIKRIETNVLARLDAIPDVGAEGCAEAAREFAAYWKHVSNFVELSVSYPIVDYMSEQAAVLVACAECKDQFGFRAALALLYDTVEDMSRLET